MPEGPSILHLRNKLSPFIGKVVKDAGGYGSIPTAWLVGKKLSDITTHGKYLFFHFKDGIVQVHLGLFGSVIINEQKTVNRKFYLVFANGEINCYIVNAKKIDTKAFNSFDPRTDILSEKFNAIYVKSLIEAQTKKLIEDKPLPMPSWIASCINPQDKVTGRIDEKN